VKLAVVMFCCTSHQCSKVLSYIELHLPSRANETVENGLQLHNFCCISRKFPPSSSHQKSHSVSKVFRQSFHHALTSKSLLGVHFPFSSLLFRLTFTELRTYSLWTLQKFCCTSHLCLLSAPAPVRLHVFFRYPSPTLQVANECPRTPVTHTTFTPPKPFQFVAHRTKWRREMAPPLRNSISTLEVESKLE
jgi:hypothetical protein